MGRHKENYTKEEALKLYKNFRLKFIIDFMSIYNKSPQHTSKMLNENFTHEEVVGIDSMVRNIELSNG